MELVASPAFVREHGQPQTPQDLAHLPLLWMYERANDQVWDLADGNGRRERIEVQPRLVSGEFSVLLEAARQGAGIGLLPAAICAVALAEGTLVRVLPDWSGPLGRMHFVYPSRRGLLPGVRALVDFLAEKLPQAELRSRGKAATARPRRPKRALAGK